MASLRDVTRISILAATGWILMELLEVPLFPQAPYLRYDAGDIPVLIAAFALGPWKGVAVAALKSLLYAMFHMSPDVLVVGVPMNFMSGASFALVAGAIYAPRKTRDRAVGALTAGALFSTAWMLLANLTMLPWFLAMFLPGVPRPDPQALWGLLLTMVVPFNLLKGALNGVLVFTVYKRISPTLKAWRWEDPPMTPQALSPSGFPPAEPASEG